VILHLLTQAPNLAVKIVGNPPPLSSDAVISEREAHHPKKFRLPSTHFSTARL